MQHNDNSRSSKRYLTGRALNKIKSMILDELKQIKGCGDLLEEENRIEAVIIFCAALAAVHASLVGPLGLGAPVLAAGPLGLGLGKGLIAAPAVATVSSQRTAINHVAPAAPIAAAAPIALANGLVGNGLIANGLVGNGLVANGLVGNGLIANGLVANRVIGNGILANGVIAGNGILANGLVGGHGIAGAPLAIGTGLLGAPVGLGLGLGLGKAIL
ncbi:uncharacterized protein CEXT_729201 [Caerostris extrusa]|uniref:Uncharacterized protein n=1 Tax=Caerostris extrusa TaxID=172846 RepID=A0AAV4TPH2_CAEEX|nr:uncharacterized protein CEXT_729201 [Caerostris extrusa]